MSLASAVRSTRRWRPLHDSRGRCERRPPYAHGGGESRLAYVYRDDTRARDDAVVSVSVGRPHRHLLLQGARPEQGRLYRRRSAARPAIRQTLRTHRESVAMGRGLRRDARLGRRRNHAFQARPPEEGQRRRDRCNGRRQERDGDLDALELRERRLRRDDKPLRPRRRESLGPIADRPRRGAGLQRRHHGVARRVQNQSVAARRPLRGPIVAISLLDGFSRPITYLRVSVTDKCNLRCVYCMPEGGLPWLRRDEILTYEEITAIVRAAASVGVRTIRLTGGEPLLRRELSRLVAAISATPGIDDVALSTNGLLLESALPDLVAAGLRRINLSLDTLRADRFEAIARRPGLDAVLAAIDAAIAFGLEPVKVNCVVMRGKNDDELLDFARLTRSRPVFVRFIEVMPVLENAEMQRDAYVSADEILGRIAADGELQPVVGPGGNGPARYFAFPHSRGAIGVISPLSHDYCERCNRVRLTADGRLRLCLFGDHAIDLRSPLRAGATVEELAVLLRSAMLIKPERHHLRLGESASQMRAFSEIGG